MAATSSTSSESSTLLKIPARSVLSLFRRIAERQLGMIGFVGISQNVGGVVSVVSAAILAKPSSSWIEKSSKMSGLGT
jgi:hypothetical protein